MSRRGRLPAGVGSLLARLGVGLAGMLLLSGCMLDSVRATPVVVHRLRTGDRAERQEAALVLGKRGPEALVPLLEKSHDPEWTVRRAVAIALGEQADPRGIRPLLTLLEDDEPLVQCAAAKSLWRIGTPDARLRIVAKEPLIISYLGSPDTELRDSALETLRAIDDEQSRAAIDAFHEWLSTQGHERKVEWDRIWRERASR